MYFNTNYNDLEIAIGLKKSKGRQNIRLDNYDK